jgi:hypothetical protein
MKFKLYVVNPYNGYEEEIKPYRDICNKHKFIEVKEHDWNEDYPYTYAGAIEINTIEELLSFRKDLIINSNGRTQKISIPLIIEEDNKIILCTNRIE